MSIISESSRIGKELDRQADLDLGYLGCDEFSIGGKESHQQWVDERRDSQATVAALCEAEQNHHVYSAAESALKDALQSLEVVLLRYQERFGDPAQLWRLTSKEYQYTKDLFAPCLATLKAAREFNGKRGEPTSLLVEQARERCNPSDKKKSAELSKETETAVNFANKFLDWVSQFERTK